MVEDPNSINVSLNFLMKCCVQGLKEPTEQQNFKHRGKSIGMLIEQTNKRPSSQNSKYQFMTYFAA